MLIISYQCNHLMCYLIRGHAHLFKRMAHPYNTVKETGTGGPLSLLAAETARDSKPCRGDVDAKLLEVLNDIIWLKDRLEIEHSPDVLGFRAAAKLAESLTAPP